MFSNNEQLVDTDFNEFYTGFVNDITFMFENCVLLTSITLCSFSTDS